MTQFYGSQLNRAANINLVFIKAFGKLYATTFGTLIEHLWLKTQLQTLPKFISTKKTIYHYYSPKKCNLKQMVLVNYDKPDPNTPTLSDSDSLKFWTQVDDFDSCLRFYSFFGPNNEVL